MSTSGRPRFDPDVVHRAARMYYLEDVNQAEVAARLDVSRPTVSRLLAEARRSGMVEITVHPPARAADLPDPDRLREALGLQQVWLARRDGGARSLLPALTEALRTLRLHPGDVLLVSSGRTLHELSSLPLPPFPGVQVVPAVGGATEPEAWHQTNEITRRLAERVGGQPHVLFAQAMPSPAMRASLEADPHFDATTRLWGRAAAALVGVGAPLPTRSSVSAFIPSDDPGLRRSVGDICLNFYAPDGSEVGFPGSERMVRVGREQLRAIPFTLAVAAGADKVASLLGGARAGLFNRLVTDAPTARLLLAGVDR